MKKLHILSLSIMLIAFQCDEEINVAADNLFDSGIYGSWEFTDETIGGITTMLPICCKFVEFYPDENLKDNQGDFRWEEETSTINGIFILDETNNLITFKRDGKDDLVYTYSISSSKDYLTLFFTETNALFEHGYTKRD